MSSELTIRYGTQSQTVSVSEISSLRGKKRAQALAGTFKDLDPKHILGLKGVLPTQAVSSGEAVHTIDLQTPLPEQWKDCELVIWGTPDGLDVIRHSMAHVLAQAVKRIYGKAVQVTIGPVIEEGFYYDFFVDKPFTPDDLPAIEKQMRRILKERIEVVRTEMPRQKAIDFFKSQGENFKAEIIQDLPPDSVISLYEQGDFIDLCRGPHVGTTGFGNIGFGLTGVSAAYWRGDHTRESLSRIYGTAFFTQEEFDAYIERKEEAKRRDHRTLGTSMDLYSFHPESPGQVLWHPKGVQLRLTLQELIREELKHLEYIEIETPLIMSDVLWKQSGHYDHYKENMFFCDIPGELPVKSKAETNAESKDQPHVRYGLKPMNCPGAALFYTSKKRSYRELPLRVSEFGRVFRYEASGVIHGLMRVRGFTQDDAHVFCRMGHVLSEVRELVNLVIRVYKLFEFSAPQFVLSTRPQEAMGEKHLWDQAEAKLKEVLDTSGAEYRIAPGDGAFYGPKIDFNVRDALGRDWQLGTIQLDFFLPQRFNCQVVTESGESEHVVVIHRAVFGSLERFLGVCIEHFGGKFPVWLAPVQVKLIPITDQYCDYLDTQVVPVLKAHGVRYEKDYRNEKLGYKIRENQVHKVPYLIIAGEKEESSKTISVRDQQGHQKQGLDLKAFLSENPWSVKDLLSRR